LATAGRRPGPNRTREALLAAARTQFAERGYAATTVRSVAAAAGVNAALIYHYFGTKERLYVAALDLPFNPVDVVTQQLAVGPRDQFAERLVRSFVGAWRDPVTGRALQAVLRRAAAEPTSAGLVRNLAEGVLLPRASAALGVPPLKLAAAMSHLVGLALAATILRIDPLATATNDELVDLVTPSVRIYLERSPGPARRVSDDRSG
jgi:AcrR family transcriptional regulator